MQLNWIDWVIIIILLYHAYEGWSAGMIPLGASFISFAIALWLAVMTHQPVSAFLTEKFGIVPAWSNVLGYITVALIAEMFISQILFALISRIPDKIMKSKANNWLGAILSVVNGFLLVIFFLLVITALPLRGTIKNDIRASTIGGFLVATTEKYGGPIESTLNQVQEQAVKFMTIDPKSDETLNLNIAPKSSDLEVDIADEQKMLILVNGERSKAGVGPLTMSDALIAVARAHSRDMFERRYFAHNSPEGQTPADRMHEGGVVFTSAGENLAYAPDLMTAHTGLMNSPEHKKNILDPAFHKVGIGIISTASWGIMVTQDFTN